MTLQRTAGERSGRRLALLVCQLIRVLVVIAG
jgi:hypothetical protein